MKFVPVKQRITNVYAQELPEKHTVERIFRRRELDSSTGEKRRRIIKELWELPDGAE